MGERFRSTRRRGPASGEDRLGPPEVPGAEEGAPGRRAPAERPPADPATKAREICYQLLTARAHTRSELEQALRRKEIPDDVAQAVLGKFDAAGLIDDAAFAETWVRSRHAHQGLARRALAVELRRKGVDDEVVAEAVAAVDTDAEEERARALVRKRLRAMAGLEEQVRLRRLVGMLARKGYPEGLAYRVVRAELRDNGDDTDLLDHLGD